jgi:hypothetical protein
VTASTVTHRPNTARQDTHLFCFSPFSKDSHKYALAVKFQKIDPPLGVIVIGAKIKRLSASLIGAKLLAHTELAVTW